MKILTMYVIVILLISGCTQNNDANISYIAELEKANLQIAELENKKYQLDQEITYLTRKIAQLEDTTDTNPFIMVGYEPYDETYRFINKDTSFFWMPDDKGRAIGYINKGTLAKISLAGHRWETGEKGDTYLFAFIMFYDTPGNNYGWIKESDTDKYTFENQMLVTDPITIPKGTKDADSIFTEEDRIGMIEKRENGQVLVMFAGGEQTWYDENDIVYPPLD